MNSSSKPLILVVDDDQDMLKLIERFLIQNNYHVITSNNGTDAINKTRDSKPDLILLDVMMPGMDGYEVCYTLQNFSDTADIPVIFVTALDKERDKAKAFEVGAVDFLTKPINKNNLLETTKKHLKKINSWKELHEKDIPWDVMIQPSNFNQFKQLLFKKFSLNPREKAGFDKINFLDIYKISNYLRVSNNEMAKQIAEYLHLEYRAVLNPDEIEIGILPLVFCKKNSVIAISEKNSKTTFVMSNPFDWPLLDKLRKVTGKNKKIVIKVTEPENFQLFFREYKGIDKISSEVKRTSITDSVNKEIALPQYKKISDISDYELEKDPVLFYSNTILNSAISERASDIHFEPKESNFIVRFRIDGDLQEKFVIKKNTGKMLISHFKVLADMDISEKRKPQDGSLIIIAHGKHYFLRLSTTLSSGGESLVMRILEPFSASKTLIELGFNNSHAKTTLEIANGNQGLILCVGPTGSGKTTTIYSILSHIDTQKKSLISIEDPIEYYIPSANQQQINEKALVTFETLLKSTVRQDPDILFIGEIRDQYSAKKAMDFASTGHITITTLHTYNAATAIFRLERLDISRSIIADSVICILAQRLLKKLCKYCKKIRQITVEENDILKSFTDEIPSHLAYPIGCPRCNNTGYNGRECVTEIIKFTPEIIEMVRRNDSIAEIRRFVKKRGNTLMIDHAIEKLKRNIFSFEEVNKKVLVDEMEVHYEGIKNDNQNIPHLDKKDVTKSILVIDDDQNIRKLLTHILEKQGYRVIPSADGFEALLHLGKESFDLILLDINMPVLDGFKLTEIIKQKGIDVPVIFLTSRTGKKDEIKGLSLGALDYIKKPFQKEILLNKVKNILS